MCCFSRPVISVSGTNIFARPDADGRQLLVYSMTINAKDELAMILPLPVKTPAGEKDLKFIDLSEYPNFFTDMEVGFQPPPKRSRHWGLESASSSSAAVLAVVQVGSFEASFVPTQKDFSRLDERFCIPADTWKQLPQYESYGFAVFKLKSGEMKVHPMAFSFPRRKANTLFFPTVHIHDGNVHEKADFDHALFCQPTHEERPVTRDWKESRGHSKSFMQVDKTQGIVVANQHCYKKEMRGKLANKDTFLVVES